MTLTYGGSIPLETIQNMEKVILGYDVAHKDNMAARNLLSMRNIGLVDIDTVRTVVGSGGNDGIAAKVTAKGVPPNITSTKIKEVDHKVYQIALGFFLQQRDLAQNAALQTRNVEWCMKNIRRLEGSMLFNGDSTINLTSMPTFAATNPSGKIVASGASGVDANNSGAWDGTDTTIDIYADVAVEALGRLGNDFSPTYLTARRSVLKNLFRLDDMRKPYHEELAPIFGKQPGDVSWMFPSDYAPAGYAFLVGKDPDAAEFVVSEDVSVDADYTKQPGKNFYIELAEWVGFEYHNAESFVSIVTT